MRKRSEVDLGFTSGYLTVIGEREIHIQKKVKYVYHLCECVCGNTVLVRVNTLVRSHKKSCGCLTKSMRNAAISAAMKKKLEKSRAST